MRTCISWLSKRRYWLQWGGISLLGIGMLITLIGGYAFHWGWTGFDKTLWEWMQLLFVPVALSLASFLFARSERQREHIAEQQKADAERQAAEQKTQWERNFAEREAALERSFTQWRLETEIKQKEAFQQETLLQNYFDRMEHLLIEKELRHSELGAEVRYTARARTLTTLQRLDLERRREVFWFLYESGLLGTQHAGRVVDVSDADWSAIELNEVRLEHVDLREVDLSQVCMQGTDLRGAQMEAAILCQANLQGANLRGANLRKADLTQANLTGADLTEADLEGAVLQEANVQEVRLNGARLQGADLRKTHLRGANLRSARLNKANLTAADLTAADLTQANLREANLAQARLFQAKLQGARYDQDQLTTAYGCGSIVR